MSGSPTRRPRWIVCLLVGLPLWLLASAGLAVWHFTRQDERRQAAEQERFAQAVSPAMIADDLRKLVELLGERHGASETGARNLTRTAAMIEGVLGPANTGYSIQRTGGPADWPLIHVRIAGRRPADPAVWVLASYDSRPGSPGGEANASGLAATLAAAQAMAGDQPAADVHFVFLPHANDPDAPVLETADAFRRLAATPRAVLCVEAMGAGGPLWLSSRDTAAAPLALAQGLGSVRGAETICLGDDIDLAGILFEMDLPAVRVATRPLVTPAEPDDRLPDPARVAEAAGRLVELIRRCAAIR